VADLFQPETRRRVIEDAEEGEVVVFGSVGRELYDRGSPVEDLAATVENEVVVRGDFAEGDG
jgi:hypothetical protein